MQKLSAAPRTVPESVPTTPSNSIELVLPLCEI
jgi:hypothetical protein